MLLRVDQSALALVCVSPIDYRTTIQSAYYLTPAVLVIIAHVCITGSSSVPTFSEWHLFALNCSRASTLARTKRDRKKKRASELHSPSPNLCRLSSRLSFVYTFHALHQRLYRQRQG